MGHLLSFSLLNRKQQGQDTASLRVEVDMLLGEQRQSLRPPGRVSAEAEEHQRLAMGRIGCRCSVPCSPEPTVVPQNNTYSPTCRWHLDATGMFWQDPLSKFVQNGFLCLRWGVSAGIPVPLPFPPPTPFS